MGAAIGLQIEEVLDQEVHPPDALHLNLCPYLQARAPQVLSGEHFDEGIGAGPDGIDDSARRRVAVTGEALEQKLPGEALLNG